MRRLFISVIALLITFAVAAQPGAQQIPVIPADKAVRVGQLPNGMKYYLRHNDKPSLRLSTPDFFLLCHAKQSFVKLNCVPNSLSPYPTRKNRPVFLFRDNKKVRFSEYCAR